MLAAVAALLLVATATVPPDSGPPDAGGLAEGDAEAPTLGALPSEIGVGTADFERQLAELGFIAYLTREMHATPDTIACSEPPTAADGVVTCFALIGGEVVMATTLASAGTGDFLFEPFQPEPTTDSVPADSEPLDAAAIADQAVVAYGQALEESAAASTAADVDADPRLTAASFTFDPVTAESRLELTVGETEGFTLSEVAWVNARGFARVHWSRTSVFRNPSATLHPGLVIVVNGEEFRSDWELMSAIADERVSRTSWTEQATAS